MSVDQATVRRVAHLSRIAVTEEEVSHLQGELNAILAFVEQLGEVDTTGVEPMTSVIPMTLRCGRTPSPTAFIPSACWPTPRWPRRLLSPCRKWWSERDDRSHPPHHHRRPRRAGAGHFTATELTTAYLGAIETAGALNAYVLTTPEKALDMAKASDARIAKARPGRWKHPARREGQLRGGRRAHHGRLHILKNFVPPYESSVTANLWQAGAVLLGKLNQTSSPWLLHRIERLRPDGEPLAAHRLDAAARAWRLLRRLGGGGGGASRRRRGGHRYGRLDPPAGGLHRTVGIKPTYGRCSRWGIVAYASSLDQAGPIARSVNDAALLLRAMAGHDAKDSTSVDCRCRIISRPAAPR